ncbi:hypothetical protein CLOSBL3_12735 [Clostridiaceae bacterium BL-3]|nr:hypothetical protein CLOSBL3_12735 [Clostridiaceae bacterium BL-3]
MFQERTGFNRKYGEIDFALYQINDFLKVQFKMYSEELMVNEDFRLVPKIS